MTTDAAPRATRPFVVATLIGIAVYVLIDIALAFLRPDYSLVRDYESDYGRGRFFWLMDINFVLRGIFSACAAIALRRSGLAPRWAAALIWVEAVASALLACFPDNPAGYPHVWTGGVHILLAVIAFVSILVAMLGTSFRAAVRANVALPILAVIALLAFLALGHPFGAGGLIERIFLVAALAWLAIAVTRQSAK